MSIFYICKTNTYNERAFLRRVASSPLIPPPCSFSIMVVAVHFTLARICKRKRRAQMHSSSSKQQAAKKKKMHLIYISCSYFSASFSAEHGHTKKERIEWNEMGARRRGTGRRWRGRGGEGGIERAGASATVVCARARACCVLRCFSFFFLFIVIYFLSFFKKIERLRWWWWLGEKEEREKGGE